VQQVLIGLACGVVAAGAACLLHRHRCRTDRSGGAPLALGRDLLGLCPPTACRIVVGGHAATSRRFNLHHADLAALVELSVLVRRHGCGVRYLPHERAPRDLGAVTEFCLGGPAVNGRTAEHLRWLLPGVRLDGPDESPEEVTLRVGDRAWPRLPDVEEYALLARVYGTSGAAPVVLLCGQTAEADHAAVRYLADEHRRLARRYPPGQPFCLLLRVVAPGAYGSGVVLPVGDVTAQALAAPTTPTTAGSSG